MPRQNIFFRTVVFAMVFFFAAAAVRAEVKVTLPLQGFYHLGRYMPVEVSAENPWKGESIYLELRAPGAVSTQILWSNDSINGVAPFLPLDKRAQRLDWIIGKHPTDGVALHVIDADQKLVGFTTADGEFGRELFPGQNVLPIRLDGAHPLAGPAAAWETLDAVILDETSLATIDEGKLQALVADGVVFAVKSQAKPFPHWPWTRVGDYWVLRFDPAGPRTLADASDAFDPYKPVANWTPGWPAAMRLRVVMVGIIFALLLLALVLWRPRGLAIWGTLFCAAVVAGLCGWWWALMPAQQRWGEILVTGPEITQSDVWTYQTSAYRCHAVMRWADICRPIFFSRDHLDGSRPKLACYSDGSPFQFEYDLAAAAKLAFLTRSCGPAAPTTSPITTVFPPSPLAPLAVQLYVHPDPAHLELAGELPAIPSPNGYYARLEGWNAVVVRRK